MQPEDWDQYETKRYNKRSMGRSAGFLFLGFAIIVLAIVMGSKGPTIDSSANTTSTAVPAKPAPQVAVELPPEAPVVKMSSLDRSYSILKGKLTFTNTNKYPVRDPSVKCEVAAASGTAIHNYLFVIYERLEPSKPKTVDYNFGFWPQQGKSLSCWSTSVTRAF
ncbi:hypothetical protein [Bradyrhizobium sp. RT10b]|uniref:hypothetical protein n=1 Tax=Bradyrhizobium sp. RT10b TaxID=3156331 RepID=UPI0033922BA4